MPPACCTRGRACPRRLPGSDIGPTNRHLIDEWNGTAREKALQHLALPGEQWSRWRRRSSVQAVERSYQPTAEELDHLWDVSVACRELWQRYLNRTGKAGCEAWLAAVRAGVASALQCTKKGTAQQILDELLTCFPQMPSGLRPVSARCPG